MSRLQVAGAAFIVGVGVGIVVSAQVRALAFWLVTAAGVAVVALGLMLVLRRR